MDFAGLTPSLTVDSALRRYDNSVIDATVVGFHWLDELLEIELLVSLDQKMLGINEVTHPLGGELEQRRVSAVAVHGSSILSLLSPDVRAILRRQHVPLQPRLFQQVDVAALVYW